MIPQKKKDVLFWSVCILLTVAYYFVKFQYPQIIALLLEQGQGELLNKVCTLSGNPSLDVYIGRMEVVVFGPLQMFLSGIIFMAVCWRYLLKISTFKFAVAVFVYFILTKFEILFYPPYGDSIGGPFAEAIWLLHHNFDYAGLAAQPDYIHGGPRVYLYTIYPGFLAILMKIFPASKIFLLVNHILVFVFGSIVLTMMRKIARLMTDDKTAMLMSILILTIPVFQSQVEAINMEMPVLMFAALSMEALSRKKLMPAALYSLAAVLIKGYAITVAGSVFVVGVILYFFDDKLRFKPSVLGWSLVALLGVVAQGAASYLAFNIKGEIDMVGPFQGWASFKIFRMTYAFFAALVVFAAIFLWDIFRRKETFRQAVTKTVEVYYLGLIVFVPAAAWYAVFLNSLAVSPRYQLLMLPFAFFSILYLLTQIPRLQKVLTVLLGVVVVFFWTTTYGSLYARLSGNDHVLLERSLEYRQDLELNLRVIREINAKFAGFTVGAPFVYAQMFVLPELGYVDKPRDVVVYGMPCLYGGIRSFNGLAQENIKHTIWLGLDKLMSDKFQYPMGPDDQLIADFYAGDRRAYLFMGGFSIERVYQYLQLMKRKRLQS